MREASGSWPTRMQPAWDVWRSNARGRTGSWPMFRALWSPSARPGCWRFARWRKLQGQRLCGSLAQLGLHELLARRRRHRAGRDHLHWACIPLVQPWLRRRRRASRRRSSVASSARCRFRAALNNTPTAIAEQRRLVDVAVRHGPRRRRSETPSPHCTTRRPFPDDLTPRARFVLYAETVDLAERTGSIGKTASI